VFALKICLFCHPCSCAVCNRRGKSKNDVTILCLFSFSWTCLFLLKLLHIDCTSSSTYQSAKRLSGLDHNVQAKWQDGIGWLSSDTNECEHDSCPDVIKRMIRVIMKRKLKREKIFRHIIRIYVYTYSCARAERAECFFNWIPNARNHLARAPG